jgi:hypothetical protein
LSYIKKNILVTEEQLDRLLNKRLKEDKSKTDMPGFEGTWESLEGLTDGLSDSPNRRFRVSIYYDINVPDSGDLEVDRDIATKIADIDRKRMKNMETYVGGAAWRPSGGFPSQEELDRL